MDTHSQLWHFAPSPQCDRTHQSFPLLLFMWPEEILILRWILVMQEGGNIHLGHWANPILSSKLYSITSSCAICYHCLALSTIFLSRLFHSVLSLFIILNIIRSWVHQLWSALAVAIEIRFLSGRENQNQVSWISPGLSWGYGDWFCIKKQQSEIFPIAGTHLSPPQYHETPPPPCYLV